MKRLSIISLALAASVASGCAHSRSLPAVSDGATTAQNAGVTAGIGPSYDRTQEAIYDPDTGAPCKHPQFPTICVKQGRSSTLGIRITCTRSGKPVECGTVTWSTKTSDKRLTWSFAPNPGNPTTETVHAARSLPPGQYSQSITATCSKVPNCPKDYSAAIYVLAK